MGHWPVSSLEGIDLNALANLERVEEHLLEKTVPKSDDHNKIEKTYAEALMSQI